MASKREREIAWALDLRRQITQARLSRREIMKLGILGTGTAFLGTHGPWVGAQEAIGPPTTPFVDPLPIAADAQPVSEAEFAANGGPVKPLEHQYYSRFPAKKLYVIPVSQNDQHRWHSQLPLGTIWGYGGSFPGVTINCRYGEPIVTRIPNRLTNGPHDFGIPQVITHAHNFHTASESDGGPWGFYDPGLSRDHHYTMARAGFTDPQFASYYQNVGDPVFQALYNEDGGGNWGDPNETLGTVFYHSHRPDYTTANVYKGQLGFMRIYDEVDAGDENRVTSRNLRLPSGKYDVVLALADKVFDNQGRMFFDAFNLEGIISDKMTVNGVVTPYMNVDGRKYRFRVVNGGPSRIVRLYLYNETQQRWIRDPFLQIASDGNLLPQPIRRGSIHLSVAERCDFVLDFRAIGAPGDRISVYNRLEQKDGRKPTGKLLAPGMPVMQFRVGSTVSDPSQVPAFLRKQPEIPAKALRDKLVHRTFRFNRAQGSWAVNGRLYSPFREDTHANIARNSAEIWTIENNSGGWVHPVHIHFEEHRVLRRNGFAPPVWEQGRKDVVHLGHGERVELLMQFRDFPDPEFAARNPGPENPGGRYVMHCHNTVHEDHSMMARWDIVV